MTYSTISYDTGVDLKTALNELTTVEGEIVKVDGFLNHRVLPGIMAEVGQRIADHVAPLSPDLILTAEASGIPPAAAAAARLALPYVYAKKFLGVGNRYSFARDVSSPTKGTEYRVEVARHILEAGLRVVIVDDFLAGGRTAQAMGEIAEEAGCEVLGMVFIIEKGFAPGRALLEQRGWPVFSLETINSVEDGIVHLG